MRDDGEPAALLNTHDYPFGILTARSRQRTKTKYMDAPFAFEFEAGNKNELGVAESA